MAEGEYRFPARFERDSTSRSEGFRRVERLAYKEGVLCIPIFGTVPSCAPRVSQIIDMGDYSKYHEKM
jgi:hypothetical protein